MDFMTIIGLVAGVASVYYVMAVGGILHMLVNPSAAVLVFGGTLAATMISYSWDVLRYVPASFKYMFLSQKNTHQYRQELIEQLISLAEKARRMNIESLQSDISNVENEFLAYGIQMTVDGLEPEVVRDNLEKEILYTRQHNIKLGNVFNTMATLAPIFGLLGTLIGVVQVLRNLSDPSNMGSAMAIAITTTFYGIFAANFVFLPVATKLNEHSENDVVTRELIAEGVMSIQHGDLPYIVKKKLNAFVISHLRESESRAATK
jgi:chemotaxis protein MotA